jgi:hypothetical protein
MSFGLKALFEERLDVFPAEPSSILHATTDQVETVIESLVKSVMSCKRKLRNMRVPSSISSGVSTLKWLPMLSSPWTLFADCNA